jgi:uncharacterized protein (TIGR03067 family)
MRSATLLLLAMVVVSTLAAPLPFPKPPKPAAPDLKALQGEWEMVGLTYSGRQEIGPVRVTLRVSGERLTFLLHRVAIASLLSEEGKPMTDWTVTLDPKKAPREMDLRPIGGAMTDRLGPTVRAVYRLEGDSLTISRFLRSKGGERPTDFEGQKDGEWMEVYKRKR